MFLSCENPFQQVGLRRFPGGGTAENSCRLCCRDFLPVGLQRFPAGLTTGRAAEISCRSGWRDFLQVGLQRFKANLSCLHAVTQLSQITGNTSSADIHLAHNVSFCVLDMIIVMKNRIVQCVSSFQVFAASFLANCSHVC